MENRSDLESRLDQIESVLKMLLVSTVLNKDVEEKLRRESEQKARSLLELLGFLNIRLNCIENDFYVFVGLDKNKSLKSIKEMYLQAEKLLDGIKIVFVFEQLSQKRKNIFENSRISYCVVGGEIRIF